MQDIVLLISHFLSMNNIFCSLNYFNFFYSAKRSMEFIATLLSSTTARPVQMPPGLSTLQEELAHICGTLLRLVTHNRSVFGEYYVDILTDHIKTERQKKEREEKKEESSKEDAVASTSSSD